MNVKARDVLAIVGYSLLGLGVFVSVVSMSDIHFNRPDMLVPLWGYGIASAVVGLTMIRWSYSKEKQRAAGKKGRSLSLASMKTSVKEGLFASRRWLSAVSLVIAIGMAVFLVGLGTASWAGYLAHNMTNEDRILDQEFDAYQGLTVVGIMIASIGIGIVVYGLFFENRDNDEGRIPRAAAVIGVSVAAFFLGSGFWAGLATMHMETLRSDYEAKYEYLRLWTIVGFWLGSLGMVVAIYGISSSVGTRARKRPRT